MAPSMGRVSTMEKDIWALTIFIPLSTNSFTCRLYTCVYFAECYSVLQCVAVCCSVLQCVAVCYSVLQRYSIVCCRPPPPSCEDCVHIYVLQYVAVCCSVSTMEKDVCVWECERESERERDEDTRALQINTVCLFVYLQIYSAYPTCSDIFRN